MVYSDALGNVSASQLNESWFNLRLELLSVCGLTAILPKIPPKIIALGRLTMLSMCVTGTKYLIKMN